MTARCERYGIRRKTGYQWIERDLRLGPHGLEERSRKPGRHPKQTPESIVRASLEARQRHPAWGAKKRLSILGKRHAHWPWPARSTVCEMLRRHGLVPKPRHRRPSGHPGIPTTLIAAPNEVWTADFTGPLKTSDGLYGDPLTVADGCRRLLLGCQARSSTRVQEAKLVFVRRFTDCGLPKRIRTDNGVPFATNTRARRSPLSAWWVRRGILPACIAPGTPPQNGRHERRHRTLTAETTRPPANTRRAQQDQFDHFRQECTFERPHEALDRQTPASR
jgi:putative transposase